jgi:ubiquinone/menaquinone biosynthesis C-methylase UbiE
MTTEDRERMRAFYDNLGEDEWSRLEATPRGRVSFAVHRKFLERYLKSGDHVLEVGAGPGRFTIELARLGANVDVTDFSPVQLELHRQHVGDTPAELSVLTREILDVCDTSRYDDDTFDCALAYGGPLSYAFEHTEEALEGLIRITKPHGFVVASVMSWLGSWRYFFDDAMVDNERASEDANDLTLATGDLRHFG